jgi:hypothetical protein
MAGTTADTAVEAAEAAEAVEAEATASKFHFDLGIHNPKTYALGMRGSE